MRIKAYAQLLESYRSLTMDSMCAAFGVGPEFIDKCGRSPVCALYFDRQLTRRAAPPGLPAATSRG